MFDLNLKTVQEVDLGDSFVSTATDYVSEAHGPVIQTSGNTALLSVQLISAASTGTFNLEVWGEGSYDGVVWYRSGLASLYRQFLSTDPSNSASSPVTISYPYLRVRTTITDGAALVRGSLVFQEN